MKAKQVEVEGNLCLKSLLEEPKTSLVVRTKPFPFLTILDFLTTMLVQKSTTVMSAPDDAIA